jgi:predicted branched-subunit amino acid permease
MLLDVGMNHKTASLTLYSAQILLLIFAFFPLPALILIIILAVLITLLLLHEAQKLGLLKLAKNKIKKLFKKTDQMAHSN